MEAAEEKEGRSGEAGGNNVVSSLQRARLKLPGLRTLSDQPLSNTPRPPASSDLVPLHPMLSLAKEPVIDSPAEPEIKCLARSLRKSSPLSPSVCTTEMTMSVFISAFASSTENNTLHSYSKG